MFDPKNSRAYRKAKQLVSATLASPNKLAELIASAKDKASGVASARLAPILDPLKTSYRLVSAYARGEYRDIELDKIVLLVAALIYFVMPLDALPDFIALFGFADDAAILTWTLTTLKEQLDRFSQWEQQLARRVPEDDDENS